MLIPPDSVSLSNAEDYHQSSVLQAEQIRAQPNPIPIPVEVELTALASH